MLGKVLIAAMTALVFFVVLIGAAAGGIAALLTGGSKPSPQQPSQEALADIPGNYLALYQQAAPQCPGLDWSILAAIGKVETNHGRLNAPGVSAGSNAAGAQGPMQFLPATFAAYDEPIPPGGSNPPSPYDPVNAIYAAARYLCDSGARDGRDTYSAIFAYNHADWYVRKVLDQAQKYRSAQQQTPQAGLWVVPARGQCSSGFGPREGEFHAGQDIAASIGTPIVAASSGTVTSRLGPPAATGCGSRSSTPVAWSPSTGTTTVTSSQQDRQFRPGNPSQKSATAVNPQGPTCTSRSKKAASLSIPSPSTSSAAGHGCVAHAPRHLSRGWLTGRMAGWRQRSAGGYPCNPSRSLCWSRVWLARWHVSSRPDVAAGGRHYQARSPASCRSERELRPHGGFGQARLVNEPHSQNGSRPRLVKPGQVFR